MKKKRLPSLPCSYYSKLFERHTTIRTVVYLVLLIDLEFVQKWINGLLSDMSVDHCFHQLYLFLFADQSREHSFIRFQVSMILVCMNLWGCDCDYVIMEVNRQLKTVASKLTLVWYSILSLFDLVVEQYLEVLGKVRQLGKETGNTLQKS